MVTEFAVGIMQSSKNAAAASALIKMLQSPEAKAAFRAKGLDPKRVISTGRRNTLS
jgi:ABC-type molybdate transport system substrate-binding protein